MTSLPYGTCSCHLRRVRGALLAWPTTAASQQITTEIHISDSTHKFQNKTGLDAKANSELYKSKRVCSASSRGLIVSPDLHLLSTVGDPLSQSQAMSEGLRQVIRTTPQKFSLPSPTSSTCTGKLVCYTLTKLLGVLVISSFSKIPKLLITSS